MIYSSTEYFTSREKITDAEWKKATLHSCPECNPSEHVRDKRGMYICLFCGRVWKNHFKHTGKSG